MTILGTYKGRHRHPNRRGRWESLRPNAVRTLLLAAIFAVTLTTGQAAHAATIASPAQEAAACAAVYHMHHQIATDAVIYDAWYHAWHEANYADPEMRAGIHRWLTTGHGWSLVRYACNPDEGL